MRQTAADGSSDAGSRTRVLMVEDNSAFGSATQAALDMLADDVELRLVDSLRDAERLLTAGEQFDVALTDLSLPDADGAAAPARLHELNPRLVIVVLTGDRDADLALELIRLGIQDYIVKAEASPEQILRTIRLAVARHQRQVLRERWAKLDPVTGVLNRAGLVEVLQETLSIAQDLGLSYALCTIDVDRFKLINDTYGHPTGDRVLQEASSRLKRCLRANDAIGRAGGDEFWAVLGGMVSRRDPMCAAQRLVRCFEQPFEIDGATFEVSVSVGLALMPEDATAIDEWIERSDAAMYRAKRSGGGWHCYGSDSG